IDPAPGAPTNPLKDLRVRQALSMAINRVALADQGMQGDAVPAGQMLPPGASGASPKLQPVPFDPERAKALLKEAGFPNGLAVTIHGSSDRLPNDARVVQTIAQFWTRIGVKAQAEVLPFNIL